MAPNPRIVVWREHHAIVRDDYVILVNASLSSGAAPMPSRDTVRDAVIAALVAAGASGSRPVSAEMVMIQAGARNPEASRMTQDPTSHFGTTPADHARWDHTPGPGEPAYVLPQACSSQQAPPPAPVCGNEGTPCCQNDACGEGLRCASGTCVRQAGGGGGGGGGGGTDTTGMKLSTKVGAGIVAVAIAGGLVLVLRSSGSRDGVAR
jgi:hypothetical protein